MKWPSLAHYARKTGMLQSSDIFGLEKVLFNPRKSTNYQNWLFAFCFYGARDDDNSDETFEGIPSTTKDLLSPDISTLHISTAFNLVEISIWLIDNGALSHPKDVTPTVLDFAVAGVFIFLRRQLTDIHQPFYDLFQSSYSPVYKDPRLREVLLARGQKASNCTYWGSKNMFVVAWDVAYVSDSLSSLQCILESGWLLSPEDISTSQQRLEGEYEGDESATLEFVHYLNSSGLYKSELGHQLCALIWSYAIRLDFDFVSDESLLPTDITLSHEALYYKAITAVERDDLESLKACEHDPRFDFGMTTTDDEARSLLHIALQRNASEVLEYLISVARCNIDKPDSRGRTPLHYAVTNLHPSPTSPGIVLLLEAGASLVATDKMGWNFFHHYANKTSDIVDLRELRKSMHRAKNEDHNQFPKESLSGGTAQDSISSKISFTDWQSINISCCNEKACVWEIAASCGSVTVLRALDDVDFPCHSGHDSERHPFQSINYDISLEAFSLLQSQFPSDLHVEKDGNLPVVTFLSKCIKEIESYKVNGIDANVIRALLEASPTISSTIQQALDFCCNLMRNPVSIRRKKKLLAPFLDYGFDMHPTAPLPSTLSQVWLLFLTEGKNYGSSSDSVSKSSLNSDHESDGQSDHESDEQSDYEVDYELRSLMSLILDHVDANKLNQLDSAGLSIIHKTYGPLNADREWFILELIKRGADVNVCGAGQNSHTPLVTHLYASSIDSALIILNSGADPTLAYPGCFDAVQAAIHKGAIQFLRRLLELADTASFNIEWTRLGSIAYRNPVNYVVGGLNVLHLAVLSGSLECFDLLINKQLYTSIHSTSHQSYNCMHFAAWRGSTQMIEHLHTLGVSISHAGTDGTTPLHMAVRANQIGAVQKLLDLKAPMVANVFGLTPFLVAKKLNLNHILETLSDSGKLPQINWEGGVFIEKAHSWTCISGALIVRMIKHGNTKALVTLLSHLKENRVEYAHLLGCTPETVVTYIVNGGSDVNPIHEAVWQGKLEAVELLVEYGADVHALDTYGTISLHLCKGKDTANYLLSIGATPTLPPWNHWYRLSSKSIEDLMDLSKQVAQLASSLEDGGPGPKHLDRKFLSSFMKNGNVLDMQDDVGGSIVHLSLYSYATGSMVLNGAVRLADSKPFPWHQMCYPTHNASWIGSLWRLYRRRFRLEDLRLVSNLHPGQGWSPMCLATCTDNTLVMANCLEMGADIDFEGSPYGSALMAAAFSNRLESVKFLVRTGAAICYEGKDGFKSAVIIGKRCQRVIDWLIMDRFMDQEKLEGIPEPSVEVGDSPQVTTGVWSSRVVPLRLMGIFERQPHESSFSYLQRLAVIKSGMRGKVVPLPRPEILSKMAFTATYSL
ncbi:hypothetical protein G7054_g744 [Neopestalotiopsis clavispora]|nr:hypothetical protein G7054_g744 [Neopestalotiopsis clavispora]